MSTTTQVSIVRRALNQQLQLCKRLLAVCEEQTQALIVNDLEKLRELEAEQRLYIEQQFQQEQIRVEAVTSLAKALDLPELPSLADLLPHLPERESEPLGQLKKELMTVLTRLEDVQSRNVQLLQNAQEYVRFSLELITGAMLQPARYGSNFHAVVAPSFYVDSRV